MESITIVLPPWFFSFIVWTLLLSLSLSPGTPPAIPYIQSCWCKWSFYKKLLRFCNFNLSVWIVIFFSSFFLISFIWGREYFSNTDSGFSRTFVHLMKSQDYRDIEVFASFHSSPSLLSNSPFKLPGTRKKPNARAYTWDHHLPGRR